MSFKKTGDGKVIGKPKEYGELPKKEKQNPKEKKGEKHEGLRRSK